MKMNFKELIVFVIMFIGQVYSFAQSDFAYQQPDDAILKLADARPAPAIRLNNESTKAILLYRHAYKSIDELSEPEMRLGGIRVNPLTNGPGRSVYYIDVNILDVSTGNIVTPDGLPNNPKMGNFVWSFDQTKMAFTNTVGDGIELWLLDVEKKQAKRLSQAILNGALGNPILWSRDDKYILAKTLPANRKKLIDRTSRVPSGPTIAESDGQKAQNRTYQDLLKNPVDEANFETLVTSEITRYQLDGKSEVIKPAAIYASIAFSPDGNFMMSYEVKKPFSYLVTYGRFPADINISDSDGRFLMTFHHYPLTEELPKGFMAVRKGKRGISWRADKPATLYWAEALDEGDPANEVEYRDAVYELNAPFNEESRLLVKTGDRYGGILWGNDDLGVVYEQWWNTRKVKTLFFNPSDNTKIPILFNERNSQDRYSDPGDFTTSKNEFNLYTLDVIDNKVYMIGEGYSEEGKFPFVDRYDLTFMTKERIYQSQETSKLEDLVTNIDTEKGLYLTRLESKTEYPNYYIRNIYADTLRQISFNENPFKQLSEVDKEVLRYKRDDGVELSATLYLPVGYDKAKKEKMPMIMWAYPREFKDKNSAGQVTANENEFIFPYYGSPLYWLVRGYVVLDGASFPIIGEGEAEPNDRFVQQLVANAKAAIDAVDELGYIDRNKVAVGGHSYGAFMTANLLTHSDLFAAGIARSGAYNRTLTPFGFQSEERNYWEASDVYNTMSPFQNADKMKTPILLIHGEEDNNSGTYPMQSERYFNALKGLGATARLVILPKESHGYAARESILHMLWEQDQWLEKYVKNRVVSEVKN